MFNSPGRRRTRLFPRHRHVDLTRGVQYGWVRTEGRAVAVAVHQPASPRRDGTVLIAGSPGRERVTTQRTMVHVARTLAAEGWRVVRFDWTGTGLSPWPEETQPAQLWADDLEAVRQWAAHAGPVHGLGIRLGGSIMAASPADGWESRHVWGPVSGKRWLRHHSMLRRMAGDTLPAREASGTELTGLYFSAEGTAALNGLPEPQPDDAHRVSVLAGPGMDALPFDVNPLIATVPQDAASTIAAALDAVDTAGPRSFDAVVPARPSDDERALVPEESVEISVAGTPVRLRHARVGQGNRPALITSPMAPAPGAPGVAFVSLGSESMEAPGSLWARTAVVASARGAVCLLAERTDTGELARPGQARDSNPYARYTLRESREVVLRLAELTSGPLMAAGVCLGAWSLAASAHRLPPHVTRRLRLLVINNIAWQRVPEYYWRRGRVGDVPAQPLAAEVSAQEPVDATSRPSPLGLAKAIARPVVRGVRYVAWEGPRWVTTLASEARVIDLPRPMMRHLSRVPGLFVNLVFGPEDAQDTRVSPGPVGEHGEVTVLDPLDHSLHAAASQRAMFEYVLSELAAR